MPKQIATATTEGIKKEKGYVKRRDEAEVD
jgi:hypothetical protein